MIDPSELDLSMLPSVALAERSQLPTVPCIYFAIDSQGVVQYIGKSVNPAARWGKHHRQEQLEQVDSVRIAYLLVSDPKLLNGIEQALIAWFVPLLNVTRSINPFGRGMMGLRLRSGKRAEEIAVELGVAVSTVRNWDQLKTAPRMTPAGLQRLIVTYGCTFEELVQAELSVRGQQ